MQNAPVAKEPSKLIFLPKAEDVDVSGSSERVPQLHNHFFIVAHWNESVTPFVDISSPDVDGHPELPRFKSQAPFLLEKLNVWLDPTPHFVDEGLIEVLIILQVFSMLTP